MEKVTIVMSIYRPQPEHLKLQLESLNAQSYENLELLVRNDCPEEKTDRELFEKTIDRFPVIFCEEGKNLGYTGAFGRLSALAQGDYISYCDQDDIWLPDKIEACMKAIREDGSIAAVCDRSLMTAEGEIYCESVRANNRTASASWKTGDDITRRAAFFSHCTGMTLIARREAVQKTLPLVPSLPHDQQLLFFLSAEGKISYVEKPLVRHRRHGKNNSGTLIGVEKKQDYYDTRCKPVEELINRFEKLHPDYPGLQEMKSCCEARIRGDVRGLWKYRELIPDLYRYEIGLALCPDPVFRRLKHIVARPVNRG